MKSFLVLIILIFLTACTSARYDYYPENKADYGTIELDLNSKEPRLLKQAEIYKQSMYLMHAYQGLLRMLDENDFSDTRVVAWY